MNSSTHKPSLLFVLLLLISLSALAQSSSHDLLREADSLFAQGVSLYNDGAYKEALTAFEQCESIESSQLPDSLSKRAYPSIWVAACYNKMGDTEKARSISPNYECPIDRRLTIVSDSLAKIGDMYRQQNNYGKTLEYYLATAKIEKENLGSHSPWYGNSILNIIGLLQDQFYTESSMSFPLINAYLSEVFPSFSSCPYYCETHTINLAHCVQLFQQEASQISSSLSKNDEATLSDISLFYENLIKLFAFTQSAVFLSPADEYYGRVIEQYIYILRNIGRENEAFDLLSNSLKTCSINKVFNANAVVVELSMGRLCGLENENKAREIYSNVFSAIENKVDFENVDERVWVEYRLLNGETVFDALDLNNLWISLALKCASSKSFSYTENKSFAMKMASLYEGAGDYEIAKDIYIQLCPSTDTVYSLDDCYAISRLARFYYKTGDYQEAASTYQQLEQYVSVFPVGAMNLYDDIRNCYEKLGDFKNYKSYNDKHKANLWNLLHNEFSEDNIDRTSMDENALIRFDLEKQSIINHLYADYLQDNEIDNMLPLLDYALAYGSLIKDYDWLINTYIKYSNVYGYIGFQNPKKSNAYLYKAISLCDSLEPDYGLDKTDQHKGSCFSGIAFNYETMSAEPELALEYYGKSVEYMKNFLNELKQNETYPKETIYDITRIELDMVTHTLWNYAVICHELGIYSDFVLHSTIDLVEIVNDLLTEQDKFEILADAYQSDFEMLEIRNLYNVRFEIDTAECRNKIEKIKTLFDENKRWVSPKNLYDLGDDYLLIGDSTNALSCFENAVSTVEKDDYMYWRYQEQLSEMRGDKDWMNLMVSELDEGTKDADTCTRIKSLYEISQSFELSLFEFNKSTRELEYNHEIANYLISIYKEIISKYSPATCKFDDMPTLYENLMNSCMITKDYNTLKDYYSECMIAISPTNKHRLLNDWFDYNFSDGCGLGEALTMAYPNESIDNGVIYNDILFRKNALLNVSIALSNLIKSESDSLLVKKYERIERLKSAFLSENDSIEDLGRILDRNEALGLIHRFQDEIREGSSYFDDFKASLDITWQDVQATLEPNEVAIEFSRFSDLNETPQYAVLILKADGPPTFKYLFDESTILGIYERNNYLEEGQLDILWGPILKEIGATTTTIYMSPDGELLKIPFEYAYSDGRTLTEKYNIRRVSTTRMLTERNKHDNKEITDIVLFGGIDYDNAVTKTLGTNDFAYSNSRECINEAKYLPGSLDEVLSIEGICKEKAIHVDLYSGIEGSEDAFKQLSNRECDIVHIATHGYYISSGTDFSLIYASKNDSLVSSQEDMSLLRSGILMSGANYYSDYDRTSIDFEDGILSAYEISLMDMHGVDFVVLSACNSGLGDISGEGVFGLPRSLKKAGVNSIMISLWEVDDEATNLLMTTFYKYYLSGMSKHLSLSMAQQAVRSHTEKGWDNPKYWAAFILLDALD